MKRTRLRYQYDFDQLSAAAVVFSAASRLEASLVGSEGGERDIARQGRAVVSWTGRVGRVLHGQVHFFFLNSLVRGYFTLTRLN